jgi:quinol monooxygenase YgiN
MTSPSFIAILDVSTSEADQSAAVAQLDGERSAVRAMPGCLGFRVFCDREREGGITVLHEWVDRAAFDEYLASEAFARSGAVLRPMMTEAPSSRRFQVELAETVG